MSRAAPGTSRAAGAPAACACRSSRPLRDSRRSPQPSRRSRGAAGLQGLCALNGGAKKRKGTVATYSCPVDGLVHGRRSLRPRGRSSPERGATSRVLEALHYVHAQCMRSRQQARIHSVQTPCLSARAQRRQHRHKLSALADYASHEHVPCYGCVAITFSSRSARGLAAKSSRSSATTEDMTCRRNSASAVLGRLGSERED